MCVSVYVCVCVYFRAGPLLCGSMLSSSPRTKSAKYERFFVLIDFSLPIKKINSVEQVCGKYSDINTKHEMIFFY